MLFVTKNKSGWHAAWNKLFTNFIFNFTSNDTSFVGFRVCFSWSLYYKYVYYEEFVT
jgi:hypothetical protein